MSIKTIPMIKNTLSSLKKFNFSDDKIKIIKGTDPKNFGKKFSPEEMEKYLDPFGFLGAEEYNKVKNQLSEKPEAEADIEKEVITSAAENKPTEQANEAKETIVQRLENLEKIEDRAKKADEKCKIMPTEYGYKFNGPEPTRYGDWNIKGKCVDF